MSFDHPALKKPPYRLYLMAKIFGKKVEPGKYILKGKIYTRDRIDWKANEY